MLSPVLMLVWTVFTLYFHPLAKFRGPTAAALSRHWVKAVLTSGKAEKIFEALHAEYGERIMPELTRDPLHLWSPLTIFCLPSTCRHQSTTHRAKRASHQRCHPLQDCLRQPKTVSERKGILRGLPHSPHPIFRDRHKPARRAEAQGEAPILTCWCLEAGTRDKKQDLGVRQESGIHWGRSPNQRQQCFSMHDARHPLGIRVWLPVRRHQPNARRLSERLDCSL